MSKLSKYRKGIIKGAISILEFEILMISMSYVFYLFLEKLFM